jgi:hypothetical protein
MTAVSGVCRAARKRLRQHCRIVSFGTLLLPARILAMSEKPKFHSKMIKDGRWTVAVSTGYGPVSHVGNFATEEEATRWIATESKNWSQPADKPERH